jgi:hypothetical protein
VDFRPLFGNGSTYLDLLNDPVGHFASHFLAVIGEPLVRQKLNSAIYVCHNAGHILYQIDFLR